jgi:hypothetical protein
MHARRTVTTDLIGSWAACSSAQVPGFTGFTDVVAIGVVVALVAEASDGVDSVVEDLAAVDSQRDVADLPDEADLLVVER